MNLPAKAMEEFAARVRPPAKSSSYSSRVRPRAIMVGEDVVVRSDEGRAVPNGRITSDQVSAGLAFARDALRSHANALAGLGMPIAHVYAAAASESAQRAIDGIAVAEEQIAWARPTDGRAGYASLSDWL